MDRIIHSWPFPRIATSDFLSQFKIGDEFVVSDESRWRVTDLGSRTLIAIRLNKEDESEYNGPPYKVQECVFDEYDFPVVKKV